MSDLYWSNFDHCKFTVILGAVSLQIIHLEVEFMPTDLYKFLKQRIPTQNINNTNLSSCGVAKR